MKMFGTNAPKSSNTAATAVDTLIGRQTEVLGDVHFSGGLHVDGKIKGKVIAKSDKAASLSVSDTGTIEGDVRVPNIVLNGTVSGDVHASEKITLAAKARVTGNVFYKIIEMEGGALVNGNMVHEPSSGGMAPPATATPGQPSVDELREARRVKGLGGS
jgi:cytoskeletal protein CcmA (bactofilin family)